MSRRLSKTCMDPVLIIAQIIVQIIVLTIVRINTRISVLTIVPICRLPSLASEISWLLSCLS